MDIPRHFHVVFDVRVLDLNLSNHDINTRDLVKFGFKEKIGSLSERSVPVIFISMGGADHVGGTCRSRTGSKPCCYYFKDVFSYNNIKRK